MKNINKIWYPSVTNIVSYNKYIVNKWPATKAEKHEILNKQKIQDAILQAKQFPGSIEDKAAVLVRVLQYHPFGSANRRTAYFTMNKFLWKNKGYMIVKEEKKGKEFMTKIRKDELTHEQIKQEISN